MEWIIAHLVGDFIIQNDWMAKGKKDKSWICSVHVLTYITPFLFLHLSWIALILIVIQHFAQDRTSFVKWTMLKLGKPVFAEPPMAPWSIILMDQIYHIIFIQIVIAWKV